MARLLRTLFFALLAASAPTLSAQEAPAAGGPGKPAGQSRKATMLDSPIDYTASDSIIVLVADRREILVGNGVVKYQDIELRADYIEIDFGRNEVFASGRRDSLGDLVGIPIFKEGAEEFEAQNIRYNFQTKKGLIQDVVTAQGDGFLHSAVTKKHSENTIDLKKGKYTTCDHEHPHFYIAMSRARLIQNEKIVSGPLYLVIEDIPTPIWIPFGYFPFTKERASGIIIPSYGDSRERGLYLSGGGYYWAGTDHMDLRLIGSIYTKGSWDLETRLRYKIRYKSSGTLSFKYEHIQIGERGLSDEVNTSGYTFIWNHAQDPKANPNSVFRANVNLRSTSSNTYSTNLNYYVQNTVTSDVSYQRSITGTPFSLSANAQHVLNTRDSTVTLTFPRMTLTMARQTPFAGLGKAGKRRWWHTVGVDYSGDLLGRAKMRESDFMRPQMLGMFDYGAQHRVRSSASIKLLKHLNVQPSADYTERWYFDRIEKQLALGNHDAWNPFVPDTITTDTVAGFHRVWDYRAAVSASSKIYGMFNFAPQLPVEAVRVVHTPQVSFSYHPDFGLPRYGYYAYDTLDALTYSRYAHGMFGTAPRGESKNVGLSLGNNVEMKVRTPRDTARSSKKITLFDDIGLSTSYNAAADSLRWSPLALTARTRLLNNLVNLSFRSSLDWYALDPVTNRRVDLFQRSVDGKLGRLTSAVMSASVNLNSNTFDKDKKEKPAAPEPGDYNYYYSYFEIPWAVSLSYNYGYTKPANTRTIQNTLNLRGNFSVTRKWKIEGTTGYDFGRRKISLTTFGVTRDLHCWVMTFQWVPFGERQSYSFTIRVKASMLQDLKYDKRKEYYDMVR